jgi:hypothetical protein
MAQRFLDGRSFVKVYGKVSVAGRAGKTRNQAHVQIVETGLHNGSNFPLYVNLHIALHKAIEGRVVELVVFSIFEEVEGTAITDGVVCRRNNDLKAEMTAVKPSSTAQVRERDCAMMPGIDFMMRLVRRLTEPRLSTSASRIRRPPPAFAMPQTVLRHSSSRQEERRAMGRDDSETAMGIMETSLTLAIPIHVII